MIQKIASKNDYFFSENYCQRLLEVAQKHFEQKGYHNTTLEAIAEASNFPKEHFVYFFANKENLLIAIKDHWEAQITMNIARHVFFENALCELKQYCTTTIDSMISYHALLPTFTEFLSHEKAKKMVLEIHQFIREEISMLTRKGIQDGSIQPIRPIQLADTIITLLEGLTIVAITDKTFNLKKRFNGIWNLIEFGLIP